ncbi:MAG TPA: 3-deoxy-7-phosphoheptulonate synthase [Gammaproteobacteria bacterium]|nr:3-deoxy-7-phosphoheptulonate synthase [Gammaproteobacteria bacterium]
MIIVLKPQTSKADADEILQLIEARGLKPLYMPGIERTVLGALGDERKLANLNFSAFPAVDEVKPILSSYKMVSREFKSENTVLNINGVNIGGDRFVVMAGPCSVESPEQLQSAAEAVVEYGGQILRGGAFKPRTSPYSFQGLGEEGLQMLQQAKKDSGLPIITEVVSSSDVDLVCQYADILQIGARNMQNYRLLRAVGSCRTPVMLKRGPSATLEELLLAAEYLLDGGNSEVMLCERGVRSFETSYRNMLDLNAVAFLKQRSHLPIIADPSHGTGIHDLVAPMALAAAAAGADGIIVEVHPDPIHAMSDAQQQLTPEDFSRLMQQLRAILPCLGRKI